MPRTDIGGVYRLNSDDSWTPLLDFADDAHSDYWGSGEQSPSWVPMELIIAYQDALATDPVDSNNLYIAAGLYTNSWDPNNGTILISRDRGDSFTQSVLPFKVGGNMPGRGLGERLAVDPNNVSTELKYRCHMPELVLGKNKVVYFGARSGHGLWKSTDMGVTWSNVTNFPSVGTYAQDPTDSSGIGSDIFGIAWITFDSNSSFPDGSGSSRIFVGVANMGSDNIFVSENGGQSWAPLAGQNNTFIPHHGMSYSSI